jgi:hypothetical protein
MNSYIGAEGNQVAGANIELDMPNLALPEEEKKGILNEEEKGDDPLYDMIPEPLDQMDVKEPMEMPDNKEIESNSQSDFANEFENQEICAEILSSTTKNKQEIFAFLNDKKGLYDFLTKEVNVFLPDYFRCPYVFMLDIVFGKKKFLKKESLAPYEESQYSYLKLDTAMNQWKEDLKDFLPDVDSSKSSVNLYCRSFFFSLVNTLLKAKADEYRAKEYKGRKKGNGKAKSAEEKNGESENKGGENLKMSAKRKKEEKDSNKKTTVSVKGLKSKRITLQADLQNSIYAKYKDIQGDEIVLTLADLKEIFISIEKEVHAMPKVHPDTRALPPISTTFLSSPDGNTKKQS